MSGRVRKALERPKRRTFAALAPLLAPDTKFAIVCPGRTGSDLLVSLVDSHPAIRCQSEALRLCPPGLASTTFLDARATAAGLHKAKAYGFKLICLPGDDPGAAERTGIPGDDGVDEKSHSNSAVVARDLVARGWHLILLERRDRLSQALSRLRGRRENRWHAYAGEANTFQPFDVDPAELLEVLDECERSTAKARAIADGRAVLDLVYEDDLCTPAAQQASVDRICDLLGLPPAPVSSNILRMAPPRAADRIANIDEVEEALRDTPWLRYLTPT